MAFGSGGIAHLGDIADAKRQAAHDVAETFDKVEGAIGQYYLSVAVGAFACWNSNDLPQMPSKLLRLRVFHLHADQRLRHILADGFLPVRSRRRIGSENVVTAVGVIELDECRAAIARMQLHAVIRRGVGHNCRGGAPPPVGAAPLIRASPPPKHPDTRARSRPFPSTAR